MPEWFNIVTRHLWETPADAIALLALFAAITAALYTRSQARSSKRQVELAQAALDTQKDAAKTQTEQTSKALEIAERSTQAAEKSADASLQSARTSRTAFEVGQRAWVIHDSTVRKIYPPDEEGMIVVGVVSNFKNCGQTPAFKLLTGQWLEAMYTFEPEYKEWDSHTSSEAVLGPGMLGNLPNTIAVSVSRMQEIEDGGIHLYLFGRIAYTDIFETQHETMWCLEYDPATKGFAYTRFHNTAT